MKSLGTMREYRKAPRCGHDGCERPAKVDGYCIGHAKRRAVDRAPLPTRRPSGLSGKALADWYIERSERTGGGCMEYSGGRGRNGRPVGGSDGDRMYVYRIVHDAYHGQPLHGMVVRHLCGNPRCIDPKHLEAGSLDENSADRFGEASLKGGRPESLGSRDYAGHAKLTEDAAREALRRLDDGERLATVAQDYGISTAQASKLQRREAWRWLDGESDARKPLWMMTHTERVADLLARSKVTARGCAVLDSRGEDRHKVSIHRHRTSAARFILAWYTGRGLHDRALVCRHMCGNSQCVHPVHLAWGTQRDNRNDEILAGIRHSALKFEHDQVREIRARREAGERIADLACEFGVACMTISNMVHRKTYASIR